MAKGFGHLYKMRGIILYSLSPFEQRAFARQLVPGFANSIRRLTEAAIYAGPPLLLGYLTYVWLEMRHAKYMRKNPADYENEQ